MELLADRDPEEARKILDPVALAMGLLNNQAEGTVSLAEAYLLAERAEEALNAARRGLDVARTHQQRAIEAAALRVLGDVLSGQAPPAASDAEDAYRDAIGLTDELGLRPETAHCHLGLGTLYRRTGKREQAQEHLTTATTLYREMDMRFWLEQAEAETKELG